MPTYTEQLAGISLSVVNGGSMVHYRQPGTPGRVCRQFTDTEAAFKFAQAQDLMQIYRTVNLCPWADDRVRAVCINMVDCEISSTSAADLVTAIYTRLADNCLDHHMETWKSLERLLQEFITNYAEIL